jgi:hypothetical protein
VAAASAYSLVMTSDSSPSHDDLVPTVLDHASDDLTAPVQARPTDSKAPEVRLSVPVIDALHGLSDAHKRSVAAAIRSIRPGVGEPLYINNRSAGSEAGRYRVVVPGDSDAPVVIFRELASSERGDFLVTALTDRKIFNDYQRAEREGALDNKAAQALVDVAVASASAARSYGEAAIEGLERSYGDAARRREGTG